jgi:hypothetical protein
VWTELSATIRHFTSMYFATIHRNAPKRNVLPTHPLRDEAARRQIAELAANVEELQRELKIQFTRTAQLQTELDEIKALLQRLTRKPSSKE